jgi:hypothetical protein
MPELTKGRSIAMRLASFTLFLLLAGTVVPAGATSDLDDMCDSPPCTQREIEAYENRASKRMFRVQALRFEARARGDRERANQLDRSFKSKQRRWIAASDALATHSQ